MKNPFRTIRKTALVIGYTIVTLMTLAILTGGGFAVASYIGRHGWGSVLLGVGMLVAFWAVLFGIAWLCSFIARKWREWEEEYAYKKRKALWEAGTPLLDPEPVVMWGSRYEYRYADTTPSAKFAPRTYYSDVEADYMTANQKVAEGRV